MTDYHAVMIGEEGSEFGVTFSAENLGAAYEYLDEMYPESRVEELKTCAQWSQAEQDRYDRLQARYNDDTYDLY